MGIRQWFKKSSPETQPVQKFKWWEFRAKSRARLDEKLSNYLPRLVQMTLERDSLINRIAKISPEEEKNPNRNAAVLNARRGMAIGNPEVAEKQKQITSLLMQLSKDAGIRLEPGALKKIIGNQYEITNLGWSGHAPMKKFGSTFYMDLGIKKRE